MFNSISGSYQTNFALRLSDEITFLATVKGGNISGEVALSNGKPGFYSKKHISKILYEDITIEVGTAMSSGLADWINTSIGGHPSLAEGAILACNPNFEVQAEMEFTKAQITEITFPTLDTTSKDPGHLTIVISPYSIRSGTGRGKLVQTQFSKQKLWNTANFRLEIDGLETNYIRKIDSFLISITPLKHRSTEIKFPDLWITLETLHSESWRDWFKDFVINGKNGEDQERNGALVLLSADMSKELGRIDLHNLGLFKMTPPRMNATDLGVPSLKAGLYCEFMEFKLGEDNQ